MRLILVLGFTMLLPGCLAFEEVEVRVLREQGEPAIVISELRNIHSDESDPVKIRKDFDDIVAWLLGDKELTEQRDKGILVKHRELFIRDNKIFFRETGIVENLSRADIETEGSVIRMKWGDSNDENTETNGHIVKRDGETFVEWPKNATELRVKTHDQVKDTFSESQPIMLQLLNDYLATHQ